MCRPFAIKCRHFPKCERRTRARTRKVHCHFKITIEKDRTVLTKEKVVPKAKKKIKTKFLQIGMSCDLAFGKGTTEPKDEEAITELAGRAGKRERELAKRARAEGADPSEHEGVGAFWAGMLERCRNRVEAQG